MAIDVKKVSKTYIRKEENFTVLNNVDLHIDDGEFICFLGPSGCGKTTLLRIIAGLEKADEGEVYDREKLITGPSKERGFIFQQYSLFPWLNVLDNVLFGLKSNEKSNKAENLATAEEYIKRVGLSEFKYNYPHELSGGMKQRVAIIRSLVNHPPILLMDEPFSAVDMLTRHSLQDQLTDIWKKSNSTILFVTHDIDEAIYLADKIVIMDKNPGRIQDIVEVPFERPRQRESEEILKFQDKIESMLAQWEV
ncbi:ABC transporter ATP-binding protein [Methanobrevibacter sp.]